MKIHEYQGKDILRQFGVPVPRGIAAFTVQEAVEAAQKLGGPVWVVKAQIHAGGRGKGGGVKVAKSVDEPSRPPVMTLPKNLKSTELSATVWAAQPGDVTEISFDAFWRCTCTWLGVWNGLPSTVPCTGWPLEATIVTVWVASLKMEAQPEASTEAATAAARANLFM